MAPDHEPEMHGPRRFARRGPPPAGPYWVTVRQSPTSGSYPCVTTWAPGDPIIGNSQHTGAKWTMAAAAALQGFPPDWPWQGTRTEIHQQIGNAVCPIVAQRLAEVNAA